VAQLELRNVGKIFGGIRAVAELSVAMEAGQISGLIGPNGAGKTTVINLITGLLSVSTGTIVFEGQDITHCSPQQIARTGISRTFQHIRLLREESVLENIVAGFHRHETTAIWTQLLGLPAARRESRQLFERARELLARFDMSEYADFSCGQLSYGHQRQIEIMRALAMAPDFLLLDEPAAGMNDVEAAALGKIIRQIADGGVTILLVEHNVRFVMSLCDRINVLESGRAIAAGTPDQIGRDPAVIEAYLGAA